MNRLVFLIAQLFLLVLVLSSPVIAQTELPGCTALLADTDDDSINDNDGVGGSIDIDKDGDGLIEICDIEGLNEIRYQLDGSGYKPSQDAIKVTQGCPNDKCRGYELVRSLDFSTDDSYRTASNQAIWTMAAGWQPIGSNGDRFRSLFEGNSHTISELHISRSAANNIGLFSTVDSAGIIRNVGLLAANIEGNSYTGGLVGQNYGSIINSYAKGMVTGNFTRTRVGGLVGQNQGSIINSYAIAKVKGVLLIGGLVGLNNSSIINSYAAGEARGTTSIGGLSSANNLGLIINSYAISRVIGNNRVSGLVDSNNGGIIASYWDKTVNADLTTTSDAKTTAELQAPTATTGIYREWSNRDWDFGASTHYPSLRYAKGGDLNACSDITTSSEVLPCGILLPNQSGRNQGLAGLFFFADGKPAAVELSSPFSQSIYRYDMTIVASDPNMQLRPYALDDNAKIAINRGNTSYFSGERANGELSDMIGLEANETTLTIIVTDTIDGSPDNTTYTFVIVRLLPIKIDVSESRLRFISEQATPDPAGGVFSYQWQQQELAGGWTNIPAATTATYWLPAVKSASIRYRVKITHTNGEGYQTVYPTQGPFRVNIDDDVDGLIDIYTIEDLYEIRYQLDGRGYRPNEDTELIMLGCPQSGCNGYELRRDLDFNATASYHTTSNKVVWTTATGWDPIDRMDDYFSGLFEGNDHTIANLYIDRTGSNIGLFTGLHAHGEIKNVGLLNISIRGNQSVGILVSQNHGKITNSFAMGGSAVSNGSVGGLVDTNRNQIISSFTDVEIHGGSIGGSIMGGLVGENQGSIANSYALGKVIGESGFDMGGLVGENQGSIINSYATGDITSMGENAGGLVGVNEGSIANAYASGTVSGAQDVGGLVGENRGSIVNTYAEGAVSGVLRVGGLVGYLSGGSITYSYSTAQVTGENDSGGLIGSNSGERDAITASYWDVTTATQPTGAGGDAKTTAQLQMPTEANGIYSEWSSNDWDFGDSNQYPALRYAKGGDLNACATEITTSLVVPPCGILLPEQKDNNQGLAGVFFFTDGAAAQVVLAPPFSELSQLTYNYTMTIVAADLNIQLRPYARNDNAKIAISQGDTHYFSSDRPNGALSDLIKLEANATTLTIVITDTIDGSPVNTTYTYAIVRLLPIRVDTSLSRLQLIFEQATPDPDGAGVFSYQWQQQQPGSGWTNIPAATTPTYWLPAGADGRIRYRVINIKHTDGGGYITDYPDQGPVRASIDDDGDGLIDIYTLEDLDAMRYQLDGSAYRPKQNAEAVMQDCPLQVCNGYELRRDLDFNVDASYLTTSNKVIWTSDGWDPIGRASNRFSTVFEGNGYTISNLYIAKSVLPVGLFSVLSSSGEIKNVRLLKLSVRGGVFIGALVGQNYGKITNSYMTDGTVSGNTQTGGLVGGNRGQIISSFVHVNVKGIGDSPLSAGGLVGWNQGSIINSYAIGAVNSNNSVGGLVGNNQGSIINSYATANVTGITNNIGGLVGLNSGSLKNTYATGTVSGSQFIGGLVGQVNLESLIINSYAIGRVHGSGGGLIGLYLANSDAIVASYWDATASGQANSAVGTSKTTAELQTPTTTSTEIYYGWSESDWDFGSSKHYPALKYVSGGLNACNPSDTISSLLPTCGTLISQQRKGLDDMLLLVGDDDVTNMLSPSFSPVKFRYETTLATTATDVRLTLQPYASNANATIKIVEQGDNRTDYFAGKLHGALSDPIISSHSTTLTIIVTDTLYDDITTDTIYTVAVALPITIAELNINLAPVADSERTIAEGSTATVRFELIGGSGDYRYQYKIIAGADETLLSQLPPPVELTIPANLVAAESTEQTVELSILVSDDAGQINDYSTDLTVQKVDNGLAKVSISQETSRTLMVTVGSDPDGNATNPDYEYQWQWRNPAASAQWLDIDSVAAALYTITDDLAITGSEFRVKVTYTDGQGYRVEGGVYSKVIQYVLLPMCTTAIADRDDDDIVGAIDIDKDGDGLIELCDLEGINEMRYQLDGSGYKISESATSIRRGCPRVDDEEQCRGYELVRSLDFNDANSYRNNTMSSEWSSGSGWLPIATNYSGIFEGNGHSISSLYINRTEDSAGSMQGLFSDLAANAQIRNIQLLHVNIQGFASVGALVGSNSGIINASSVTGRVTANSDVGGLVGINSGQVISSFANTTMTASMARGGGLVGRNHGSVSASHGGGNVMGGSRLGGLSGVNDGSILNSYATAVVSGTETSSHDIGGLVGRNNNLITNSYATGAVTATGNHVGGLVGFNNNGGIANTYAAGSVMGASQVGGLIGRHYGSLRDSYAALGMVSGNESVGGLIGIMSSTATLIASYWDVNTNGQLSSADGSAKTTSELQTPIAPGTTQTEVYYGWREGDWDFGNSNHYPALRYARDDDLNNCAIDITTATTALPCAVLLPNQRGRNNGLATVFFFADGLPTIVTSEPLFTPLTDNYIMTMLIPPGAASQIQLRPYAINAYATITVTDQTGKSYFAEKSNGALSDPIPLASRTTVTIVVTDTINEATNTAYTFTIIRTRSPLEISDFTISPSTSIDEGSDVTITYRVSGGSGVYAYAHKIDNGEFTPSPSPLVYRAPANLIGGDATTQTVTITIRVSDQAAAGEVIEQRAEITVDKIDNADISISAEVDGPRLSIILAADDTDGSGDISYQWQQLALGGEWTNIVGATTATYWLPAASNNGIRYRVNIQYTDGQGYITSYQLGPLRTSIDDDSDGLIDIYYLEDLNALHYQLDGRGYKMNLNATTSTQGCPATGCNGYELRRSLDFISDSSYSVITNKAIWTPDRTVKGDATNSGWSPIGNSRNRFNSVFEGNGYTIANLYTKHGNNKGLFSVLHGDGEIKNIGLLDVYVQGSANIGTVVGQNYGKISRSYATKGSVIFTDILVSQMGGLVGSNQTTGSQIISSFANINVRVGNNNIAGGLVGRNQGLIINSYATGNIVGLNNNVNSLGGLIGRHDSGSVINSYATGDVAGRRIGGLVGYVAGSIINTYARGRVTGEASGGLVYENRGSITNSYAAGVVFSTEANGLVGVGNNNVIQSYWDTLITGVTGQSAGGSGKTTTELQHPTAAGSTTTDIYYGWREDDWDFGDSSHYPRLRHAPGPGNLNACNPDIAVSSPIPPCALPLPGQTDRNQGLAAVFFLADGVDITEELIPTFFPLRSSYNAFIISTHTQVQLILRPYAINDNATITVTDQDNRNYFSDKANAALSDAITLTDSTTLSVIVTENINESIANTTYTFVIRRVLPLAVSGIAISAHTIDEGDITTLTFEVSGGTGAYQYEYKIITVEDEVLLAQLPPPVALTVPADIVAGDSTQQVVELNIVVSDDAGQTVEHSEALTILKVDNGVVEIAIHRETSRTLVAMVGSDPDGDVDTSSYIYQWQWREIAGRSSWMNIASANTATYTITDDLAVDGNEFRVEVMYSDGQGYNQAPQSKGIRYDLLPPCTTRITDRDDDNVEASIDADKDGDGLIELCDIEGLNEIRYQLDGSGYKASESAINIVRGCPLVDGKEQCHGYELVRSLDFNELGSYRANTTSSEWTTGSGWLPITANFASVFDGNGHSIANMYINRAEDESGFKQGLFSDLAATAQISNVRLRNVNIQGRDEVGALAGRNSGVIINSSVHGAVVANVDVGGLVGINEGSILNSYATAAVSGTETNSHDIGGLVGRNNSLITNSYATGDVTGGGDNIGGLVGLNNELGRIVNTYAEGLVMGASQVGGLVGRHNGLIMNSYAAIGAVNGAGNHIGGLVGIMSSMATLSASYWDVNTNGQLSSTDSSAKTTSELQTPIAPGTTQTEVYYGWRTDDWDFGNSNHYPALRYAGGNNLNNCATDITTTTTVLPCALLLPNQRGRDKGLATVFFFVDGLPAAVTSVPSFTPLTASYDMTIIIPENSDLKMQLRPYAINANATITATDQTGKNYFIAKSNGVLSDTILLAARTTMTIVVTDTIDGDNVNTTYTFTITSARQALAISDIVVSPSATVDEGSDVTITYRVSGGTGVYEYAHKIDNGAFISSQPSLVYSVPADLIAAAATTQIVTIMLRVSDQDATVEVLEHSVEITVRKIDNGDFSIRSEIATAQLNVIVEGNDPDGSGDFSYQWQQLKLGEAWTNIAAATTASYHFTDTNESIRYRVNMQHTDGQGYMASYQQGPFRVGIIDDDSDGLIDIYYLEDVATMHYQLDGSGYKMSMDAIINSQGCPATGCRGYELRRSLDYATTTSYSSLANKANWTADMAMTAAATNPGWSPIGSANNHFSSVFEGNGFTISGLYIKGGSDRGLFSVLHRDSEIKHVGLLNVYVDGNSNIGPLVGQNYGRIIGSYVTMGTAIADGVGRSPVGGLVGRNQTEGQIIASYADVDVMASNQVAGGLVGHNQGFIMSSYASGDVSGQNDIGGLVGRHDNGSVINSYATGDISGQRGIGGLVGYATGSITNTYARGRVSGNSNAGGLVGENRASVTNSYATGHILIAVTTNGGLVGVGDGRVTQSYWDKETTRISRISAGGSDKTTAELQNPITPGSATTDVYYGWSEDDWDFGDDSHYPALRYASSSGADVCATDITTSSAVLPCSIPLPNQSAHNHGLAAVFFFIDGVVAPVVLTPPFSSLTDSYNTVIVIPENSAPKIQLRPYAINNNATIAVTKQAQPTDYFAGKPNWALSDEIQLAGETTITIVVTESINEVTVNTAYTFVITRALPIAVSTVMVSAHPAVNDDGTINEGSTATITFAVSGGSGSYTYNYSLDGQSLPSSLAPSLMYKIPPDLIKTNSTQQTVELSIIIRDDSNQVLEHTEVLTIQKVNNGSADIAITREGDTLTVIIGADPDGATDTSSYTYQWQSRASADEPWMDIESAMDASYVITGDLARISGEFRIQMMYTDGQGYRAALESDAILYIPLSRGIKVRTKVFLEGPLR